MSKHDRLQDCTIFLRPHTAIDVFVKMDLLVFLFEGFGRCVVTVATHECLNSSPQPSGEIEGADWAVKKRMRNRNKRIS